MTRRLARALFALALCASLGGCLVGPNFTRPPAPPAKGYAMAGDAPLSKEVALGAPAAGPWWRAFGWPDLDRTIALALADNPTLAVAESNLAQARAATTAARGGLYPEIDANAGAQHERINLAAFGFSSFPGISNNPTFDLYTVGASASYALPTSGGTRRQVESAAARAEGRRYAAQAAGLALTGQVATQAATIAALRAEIAADEEIVAADRKILDLARSAIRVGSEAQGRRVGAQSQLAADEALLPPLRQSLAQARHALALLVGKAPADWTAPDFDLADLKGPPEVPVSLPSELVRRRPDILSAEADLHAATADVGVATARLYPSLSLTGSLAQNSLTPDKIFTFPSTGYSLGLGLTQPLFDGGRLRAERKESLAARRAALATYQMTVLRAFGQVADLMAALGHDEEALSADRRALEAANADLGLAEAGFKEGGLAFIAVVDAERGANAARRVVVEAAARQYLDAIQLFIAAGADWTRKP